MPRNQPSRALGAVSGETMENRHDHHLFLYPSTSQNSILTLPRETATGSPFSPTAADGVIEAGEDTKKDGDTWVGKCSESQQL